MFDVKMLINNVDVAATGNRTFDRYNPVTSEVATRAAAATEADAKAAVDAAAMPFLHGLRSVLTSGAQSSCGQPISWKSAPVKRSRA
jgi:hypothetical protein